MPAARINGFEMAYAVTGSGPPLVFVHGGFGGAATRFEPRRPWWVDELFAQHYTVVTYDRRGCGLSEIPDDGYLLSNFAEDLRGLLRHLDIERTRLMGSSAGGPIALQYALTYPATVDLLVLVNTAADLLAGEDAEPLRRMLAEREARGPDALPEDPPEADAETRARTAKLRAQIAALPAEERRRAFEAWRKHVRAYEDIDLSPLIKRLTTPAFVIHGMDDAIVPVAGGRRLTHRIERASMRALAGEGHGLLARRGCEAAQLVLDWLLEKDAQLARGETDDDDDWGPDGPPRYT